jgi:GTP-binding protein EngB required for normal cell division
MKIQRKFRLLFAVGIALLTVLFVLLFFFITQMTFELWERLETLPDWLFYSYQVVLLIFILTGLRFIVPLLLPNKVKSFHQAEKLEKPTEVSLVKEIEEAEDDGVDLEALRQEIRDLNTRKESGKVYVSLFGNVSTGKSSIVKALIPDVSIDTQIRGGSTQEITEYTWKSSSGDALILSDLPGRNEAEGVLDKLVYEEAIRSQVVIYVTDADITRSQYADLQQLQKFEKPLILAVNKSDRYTPQEREQLSQHFKQCFKGNIPTFAFISSGGEEEVVRIFPDGREEKIIRIRQANVSELAHALQREIDSQFDTLNQLRDVSVFVLLKQKLQQAKQAHREEQAEKIIRTSTRRAVIGAMASVAPGTDLVVQGILGSLMVKELCKLYDVPIRQIDVDQFLTFSQAQLKNSIPLILAVAGNGLKAFPGVGTLAGGLVQAVAYGIIFNALGHAILRTLEQRGRLQAAPAALTFKELLGENLESNAKLFARLVLKKDTGKSNGAL